MRAAGSVIGNTSCDFQLYLDGVRQASLDLNQLPRPSEIAGIEIYSGPATIPLQYKGPNSGCGVILVWTR